MNSFQTPGVATDRHFWLLSPWLWVAIGGIAGMYPMAPGGWASVSLAIADQIRLTAGILCVSLALESQRKWWANTVLVLIGLVAFGHIQRSAGYYLELILLITLVLTLSGRRWGSIVFLVTASIAITVLWSLSPYRVNHLVRLTMDWLDASRDGHAIFGAMQQNVRLGGWFGSDSSFFTHWAPESSITLEYLPSWNLSAFCRSHGSTAVLAWFGFAGAMYYWTTQRLTHVANNGLRRALFVIALFVLWLAIQPVMEIYGWLPRWMASRPISATAVSLFALALAAFTAYDTTGKSPAVWPRSWLAIRNTTIGLVVIVSIKHLILIIV